MLHYSTIVLAIATLSASVQAVPMHHTKRIAQVISDSTTKWEAACDAAGGAAQCNPIAVNAFGTLLAAAGPCDQQDNADTMIDLAKTLNNDPDMIKFAQIFAQQPRNSPNSVSVPYCQTAPKNAELNGFFQCQFQGSSQNTFVGGLAVGGAGTIPFGMTSALSPAGSCPANPSGPIADGTQLTDTIDSPGTPSAGGSASSGTGSSNSTGSGSAASVTASAPVATASSSSSSAEAGSSGSATTTAAATGASSASSSAGGFQLQNGLDAQKLNAQFASLTASSTCQDGDQACVNGGFAQCVGGAFQITPCAGGTVCAALPLVNKAGTSITCDTEADATARIAATGATGGLTGSGAGASNSTGSAAGTGSSGASASAAAAPAVTAVAAPASSATSGGFQLQNGLDAQKINAQFASLTASSSCQEGDQACVGGGFAQCVGGSFQVTQCSGGTVCAALPLVNKAGTSITCDTAADAVARITATGATGGLTGSGN